MATVAGVKIKTKVKSVRNPIFFDEKYTGSEPVWDTESAATFDDATFDNALRRSFYYYNYYYNQKDCKTYVVELMQTTELGYGKDGIKAFIRSPDKAMSMTACSLVMAHRNGMPFRGRHVTFIKQSIDIAIKSAEPEVVEVFATPAQAAYRPTIQDRLNEKTAETIGQVEGAYDELLVNGKSPDFKPYDFLTSNNVPQSQLGKYEKIFAARKDELEQVQLKQDPQLVEGYKNYKPVEIKRQIAWIESLLAGIEQYRGVKKATKKAAVRKAPSKEKLVAKLKYAKEDKSLKIVSINPADIIGATELWVYNPKTRKLGKYVADSVTGPLAIKGTTIVGFDESKSLAKTLRKPIDQLKDFAKAGKIALRTFLKDIKAVEVKLNGRISSDILLLKAV